MVTELPRDSIQTSGDLEEGSGPSLTMPAWGCDGPLQKQDSGQECKTPATASAHKLQFPSRSRFSSLQNGVNN